MRDFNVMVPADCVASNTEQENRHALDQMRKVLKADLTASPDLDFQTLTPRG